MQNINVNVVIDYFYIKNAAIPGQGLSHSDPGIEKRQQSMQWKPVSSRSPTSSNMSSLKLFNNMSCHKHQIMGSLCSFVFF